MYLKLGTKVTNNRNIISIFLNQYIQLYGPYISGRILINWVKGRQTENIIRQRQAVVILKKNRF